MSNRPTSSGPQRPSGVSDRILRRVYLLFAVFLVFGGALVAQILHVQVVQGERWRAAQSQDHVYFREVVADRGSILSDDGSVLAVTLPFYRLALDVTMIREENFPAFDDSLTALCSALGRQFAAEGLGAGHFRQLIRTARREKDRHVYLLPVKRTLNYRELKALLRLPILNQGRYRGGVIVEKVNNRRFYPFRTMARITLGFVADDTTGFKGIETAYNDHLRGRGGRQLVQRIPGGVEVPLSEYAGIEAIDGLDVVTTLNVYMQDVVSTALAQAVDRHKAKSGVAILMEVETGHIKALANYPETYNTGVATLLEPGSTFKLATLLAAAEAGQFDPNDTVQTGNGTWQVSDRTLRDAHALGRISAQQAFEKSSNVGIAKLIDRYYGKRPDEFVSRLQRLGVLGASGVDLKGEPTPDIIRPNDPHWNATTLPWLSIGYNVRLTPLQIVSFYNAVANGGKRMAPLLVKELRRGSQVVERFEPRVVDRAIASEASLALARELLEGVVTRGTAKSIASPNFTMAGKTGTAQKLENGSYQRRYRASFCGYFPAQNPRYTCFILIDDPTEGAYYGGDVAAPVFRAIADQLYATDTHLSATVKAAPRAERKVLYPISRVVHTEDARTVYNRLSISAPRDADSPYARTWQQGAVVREASFRQPSGRVPAVVGMSAKDAVAVLEGAGLTVRLRGVGRVRRQSLAAGGSYRRGQTIELTLTH